MLAWGAPVAVTATISVTLGLLTLFSMHAARVTRVLGLVGIIAGPLACWVAWLLAGRLRAAGRLARDSSRRLQSAAVTGHELVWEIDPEGVVTYMSDLSREMFGVEPADLVGHTVFVLLPEDQQAHARELLETSIAERRGWSGLTFEAYSGEGELRWVETTGVAHLDTRGDVSSFTATTRVLDAVAVQQITLDRIRDRVQSVLTDGRLTTVFQPIVAVGTGAVVGHEALSRFPDPPVQGPDRWFADADRVGLGLHLDLLALQTALSTAEQLPAFGYVSMNITPATLQSGLLTDVIAGAAIPGERIVVEITEHVSVEDYQILRAPLDELRALGVRLAVDDAGAGYASFRHILRLRPEFIKLDQEITRGIHADAARRALAAAVVMFALDVGATVIAEGVETEEELAMVATLGIDAAQGYLIGRPARASRHLGASATRR
jgi:PAS domain S-box-containing protein